MGIVDALPCIAARTRGVARLAFVFAHFVLVAVPHVLVTDASPINYVWVIIVVGIRLTLRNADVPCAALVAHPTHFLVTQVFHTVFLAGGKAIRVRQRHRRRRRVERDTGSDIVRAGSGDALESIAARTGGVARFIVTFALFVITASTHSLVTSAALPEGTEVLCTPVVAGIAQTGRNANFIRAALVAYPVRFVVAQIFHTVYLAVGKALLVVEAATRRRRWRRRRGQVDQLPHASREGKMLANRREVGAASSARVAVVIGHAFTTLAAIVSTILR